MKLKLICASYIAVQMLNGLDLGIKDQMTSVQWIHLIVQVLIAGAVALHCFLTDPNPKP